MKITQKDKFTLFMLRQQHRVSGRSGNRGMQFMALFIALNILLTGVASGYEIRGVADTAIGLGSLNGPNGYRIEGREVGDQAGRALHNAGDVNGDGLDDFIVGAPSASPDGLQSAGEAYVIFGQPTNPSALPLTNLNGTNGFRVVGVTYNDEAGYAASGAGDVNNDGFDDVIIGAPGADPTEKSPEAGAVFVVFGRAAFPARLELSSLNGTSGFRLNGIAENYRTGASVANAGDINGDGYDDILIGAPDASPGNKESIGQAYAVFGGQSFPPVFNLSSLNGANGFQINGVAAESYTGKVLSGGNDLNQDGYQDILLSAGNYLAGKSLESGTVYVIYGSDAFSAKFALSSLNGENGFRIEGINGGDNAGRSVTIAGDVNGDGRADVIIGAPYAIAHKGEVYVILGQPTYPAVFNLSTLNGANGFRLLGDEANGEAGTAVGAADVNGDGLDDVIVGASVAGTGSARFAGITYIFFGKTVFEPSTSLGSLGTGGLRLDGAAAGEQSGQTIGSGGDINGDGYDEVLIGAPNAGPGVNTDVGYIYVLQGGPTLGIELPVTHKGTPADNNLIGTSGVDVMHGHRGNDQIDAAGGNDVIKGGSGDDVHTGGAGADRLSGGNGQDMASYINSADAVTINLFTGTTAGGDAAGDSLRSIEDLRGSPAADTLVGNTRDNRLEGAGGDDALTGGLGDDAFRFGPQSGDDTIMDFVPGPESDDYLDFSPYTTLMNVNGLNIQAQGSNTRVTLPGGETITLLNVIPAALHADDYRFFGAPLAAADDFNTPANTQLKVAAPGVLDNDDNPTSNTLKAVLVASPDHGTLTLLADGGFTYTPENDFVGEDEFTYQADNGQKSNIARVTVTVTQPPPTAVDDVFIAEMEKVLEVSSPGVLGNDLSFGSIPLEAFLVDPPVDGVLVLNSNGSFSYTPSVDYPAQDSFTYQASNGLVSNIATVTINILDPDGPPVASNDSYELPVDETLSVGAPGVLGNDVNPLATPMTAKLGVKPTHGTLTLNSNGGFTYIPNAGYVGQDSFTYQADNGQLSNTATVSLKVVDGSAGSGRVLLPAIMRR